MNYLKNMILAFLLFSMSAFAQEAKETELKDQKFIFSNNICLISKKEQEDAREYILNAQEKELATLKGSLIILQLRTINNGDFKSIQCSLRYFVEKYNEYAERRGYGEAQGSLKTIILDYSKLLEKLRTDVKYKSEFEKNISGSDFNYYYGVIGDSPTNYTLFEPGFARKLYTEHIMNRKNQRQINQEEWQLLFDLFYSKNVVPPKELSAFIKSLLLRQSSSGFFNVYLNNANDLAYSDLFRSVFESVNVSNGSFPLIDSYNINLQTIKGIITSKYVPENFKCSYAREVVSKNATKISREDLIEIKKIDMPCLMEAFVDVDKFVVPEDGCPTIDFGKNEDHKKLLSKMSGDFYSKWTNCRKKCSTGDKCTFVPDPNGQYSFYNSKFDHDVSLLREMQSSTSPSRVESLFLKYDIKPAGMCVNNVCAEKISSCLDSDILKKVNDELTKNKLKSCHVDKDCFVMTTTLNCAEMAINTNPNITLGNGMPNAAMGFPQSNPYFSPNNFIKNRITKLSEQCGLPSTFNYGNGCSKNKEAKPTEAKCEKNLCVLIKQ